MPTQPNPVRLGHSVTPTVTLAILLWTWAAAPGSACSMVYDPPLSLSEDAAAVVGTVVEVVSFEATGTWWSNERGDDEVFGLLIEVDAAAWDPLEQPTFEIYPFSYDARCHYWSATPENLEKYPPGTQVWLVGSRFEEAGDSAPPRLKIKGAQNWGPWHEALAGWNRTAFDRAAREGAAGAWRATGFVVYAHHHALARLADAGTVDEQLPFLRGLQYLVRDPEQYRRLLELNLLDDRWLDRLVAEKRRLGM